MPGDVVDGNRAMKVYIAAPGAHAMTAVRAPLHHMEATKRAPLVTAQETSLRGELAELEASTRARNREMAKHLEAIDERGTRWEAKLRGEIAEEQDGHDAVVQRIDKALDAMLSDEMASLRAMIAVFHDASIPPLEEESAVNEETVETFFNVTVPDVVDKQSGKVTRKLQKANETFDIENAKIEKREAKMIARFEAHKAHTEQLFDNEAATRKAKLALIKDDIAEVERTFARAAEREKVSAERQVVQVSEALAKESQARELEDNTLLDSMLYAQEKLQTSILESFGSAPDEGNY